MKVTNILALFLVPCCLAFHPLSSQVAFVTSLRSTVPEGMTDNPCWQDIYDDDCSMSNIAAAGFVASKWIKGMPCAAGIEDCDMPEKLQTPAEYRDGGVDDVDVMSFLGLKRADSLKAHHENDKMP
ncbi:hypothetical protein MPSEU_000506000 [Mayamaea pseudoterrestris]|nr:hypothetical protein MPSEU_000506000 [Mayamaea pseudoterrestris]